MRPGSCSRPSCARRTRRTGRTGEARIVYPRNWNGDAGAARDQHGGQGARLDCSCSTTTSPAPSTPIANLRSLAPTPSATRSTIHSLRWAYLAAVTERIELATSVLVPRNARRCGGAKRPTSTCSRVRRRPARRRHRMGLGRVREPRDRLSLADNDSKAGRRPGASWTERFVTFTARSMTSSVAAIPGPRRAIPSGSADSRSLRSAGRRSRRRLHVRGDFIGPFAAPPIATPPQRQGEPLIDSVPFHRPVSANREGAARPPAGAGSGTHLGRHHQHGSQLARHTSFWPRRSWSGSRPSSATATASEWRDSCLSSRRHRWQRNRPAMAAASCLAR